ncbi:MAG: hypothetical protein ACRDI2_25680 [Chloroflexota bacterium]
MRPSRATPGGERPCASVETDSTILVDGVLVMGRAAEMVRYVVEQQGRINGRPGWVHFDHAPGQVKAGMYEAAETRRVREPGLPSRTPKDQSAV